MSRLPPGFLALCVGCLAAAEPSDEVRPAVERLLAKYGTSNGPGCASGVLLKNRVVFEGAAGAMDGGQPLTVSTPVYLASVSKQFTAAAVYKLVHSGKIRLDEPIRTWLPELPEHMAAVTIHHLLNHTSGVRDYVALQEVAGLRDPVHNDGVLRLLAAQRALNFEPGTDYEYSNSDYVLLSLLVERASGIAFGEYVKREIFKPLKMDRSWFQSGGARPYEPAQGYAFRDGALRRAVTPPQTTGDGGMYGSVSDLLRWMQNLERPRKIGGGIIRQLESRTRLQSGEVLPHASGLFWNRYKERMTVSHNGAVEGFQADIVHFPKERLSVVCLCNRGDVDAASLSRQIAEAYLGARAPSKSTAAPQVEESALPTGLSGKWESKQGFLLSTKVEGGQLIASLAGAKHSMSFNAQRNEFSAPAGSFRLLLRRRSQDAVEFGWEGDRLNSFTRLRVTAPSPSELSPYTGRFVNDELKVQWDLVLSNDSLLITTAAGWRIPVTEAAPDRFEVGPWLLEFQRDGGRISGFILHRERLWRLAFQKRVLGATVRKGKGSKRRQIPLNKDARQALLVLGYGDHAGKATSVFIGQRGPLTPRGFRSAFAATPGRRVSKT